MAIAKKIVHFLIKNPPYMPGDVAGFPPEAADNLIKAGVAEVWDGKPTKMYNPKKDKARPVKERKALLNETGGSEYVTK